MATIGVLVRAAPGWQRFCQLSPEALRELGYIEGKNVRFEFRSDKEQMSHLPELPPSLPLSLDAHIFCCDELTQNLFAQLAEPGLEATATSFDAGIGEFTGGAFDGRFNFSVTTDPDSLTVSPALAVREVWMQEEAKLSRSVVQAAAIACSELP